MLQDIGGVMDNMGDNFAKMNIDELADYIITNTTENTKLRLVGKELERQYLLLDAVKKRELIKEIVSQMPDDILANMIE